MCDLGGNSSWGQFILSIFIFTSLLLLYGLKTTATLVNYACKSFIKLTPVYFVALFLLFFVNFQFVLSMVIFVMNKTS